MSRELEVEGFAWGRNRAFGVGVYAARFRIERILHNSALPNVRGFDEVSIPGMFSLPSYSPFICYRLVLVLEPPSTATTAKHGARLFVVKHIISCKTRPITKASLREFLVALYDNTQRVDADTLTGVDDYDARTTPTPSGTKWFHDIVAPLISFWPEDGMNVDNRAQILATLQQRCTSLAVQNVVANGAGSGNSFGTTSTITTGNSTGVVKRKRADIGAARAASVYSIISNQVQPCARGDVFETLLQFFHEALLLRLTSTQCRVILGYVYETPTTFLFWPLAVSKLLADPEFEAEESTRLILFGHHSNFADYHERLLGGVGLSFDPEMPAWSWMLYEQALAMQDSANVVDGNDDDDSSSPSTKTTTSSKLPPSIVVRMAFVVYLNLERHFYYTWTSSAIPYPARTSPYLQKILMSSSDVVGGNNIDDHIRFLLDMGALTYGANSTLIQLTTIYTQELQFAQRLRALNAQLVFVDADLCCSLLFLREWQQGRVLPSSLHVPLVDDTVHVYACNRAYATYATSVLSRLVLDIFDQTPVVTTNVRVVCIWMAHKIPLAVIGRALERYTNTPGLIIHLLGDSTDFVNANFTGQPFIRFRECIAMSSPLQSRAPPTSYVIWSVSSDLIRNNRGPVGDSATAYMNVRLERQSAIDSKHGALTALFADIKKLDTKYRKHDANETYVVLCSNHASKKSLHQRLAGMSNRYCALTFQLKQLVYVEQSNSRGVLESARSIGVCAEDVASMAEIDLRRAVYEFTIDGRRYSSNRTQFNHSTFETVAHYVGVPVQTVIFVVTEHTTLVDIRIAAKYARARFILYYSYDTTYTTLKRREFVAHNDFANKIAQEYQK